MGNQESQTRREFFSELLKGTAGAAAVFPVIANLSGCSEDTIEDKAQKYPYTEQRAFGFGSSDLEIGDRVYHLFLGHTNSYKEFVERNNPTQTELKTFAIDFPDSPKEIYLPNAYTPILHPASTRKFARIGIRTPNDYDERVLPGESSYATWVQEGRAYIPTLYHVSDSVVIPSWTANGEFTDVGVLLGQIDRTVTDTQNIVGSKIKYDEVEAIANLLSGSYQGRPIDVFLILGINHGYGMTQEEFTRVGKIHGLKSGGTVEVFSLPTVEVVSKEFGISSIPDSNLGFLYANDPEHYRTSSKFPIESMARFDVPRLGKESLREQNVVIGVTTLEGYFNQYRELLNGKSLNRQTLLESRF